MPLLVSGRSRRNAEKKGPRTIRRDAAFRSDPKTDTIEARYGSAAALVDGYLPVLFLALALLIGTLYAFLVPPMQVPDEVMHFARAYSVFKGVRVASPDIDVPESFAQLKASSTGCSYTATLL